MNNPEEHKCKSTKQNISKLNSKYIERSVHHNKVGFIPGMEELLIFMHTNQHGIYHINEVNPKNHVIISIAVENRLTEFNLHS